MGGFVTQDAVPTNKCFPSNIRSGIIELSDTGDELLCAEKFPHADSHERDVNMGHTAQSVGQTTLRRATRKSKPSVHLLEKVACEGVFDTK